MTTSSTHRDEQPVPYREITDETYARLAAQTFTVEKPHPTTLLLRGPCPRCRGLIEVPIVTSVFRGSRALRDALPWGGKKDEGTDHIEPIVCTCEHDHPDRPDGRFGCGAYWTIVIPAGTSAR